jgi:hypothetical protein
MILYSSPTLRLRISQRPLIDRAAAGGAERLPADRLWRRAGLERAGPRGGHRRGTEPARLTARTTPDISYNAAVNGGVLAYYSALGSPTWVVFAGTSAGSPQWAAIIALADQAAGRPLGFINPALYAIAEGPSYANDFHDITVGNNQLSGTRRVLRAPADGLVLPVD